MDALVGGVQRVEIDHAGGVSLAVRNVPSKV